MSTVAENIGAPSAMSSDLKAGLDALDSYASILFTQYTRVVLPVDGFVFWVKSDTMRAGMVLNAYAMNAKAFNVAGATVTKAPAFYAEGSLHYATDRRQEEAETYSVNTVIFTSKVEVNDLNAIGPNTMYIATLKDGYQYAFSSRGRYYEQADLYHYSGEMIYPDMRSQIIDDPLSLNMRDPVVSNSLPLWLFFNGYAPRTPEYGFGNPGIPLFPSFLLPPNITPPFASVHIDPLQTQGIASAPFLGKKSSHYQLSSDRVVITLHGVRNDDAQTFLDMIYQRSQDFDQFGLMNIPIIRDEKRPQRELSAIAQKKTIELIVSYHQVSVRDIARQMIESVQPIDYEPQCFEFSVPIREVPLYIKGV